MNDEKRTLKKLLYEYHVEANALLRARYDDLDVAVARFLTYVEGESVIKAFLDDCVKNHVPPEFDASATVDALASQPNTISRFAPERKGETGEVYLILKDITERDKWGSNLLLYGYGHGSRKYSDMAKGFLDDVGQRLISGIDTHLTLMGIEKGLSDTSYTEQHITTGDNSNVNASMATDSATSSSTQTNGMRSDELTTLLDDLTSSITEVAEEQRRDAEELIEALKNELEQKKPKHAVLKAIMTGLKGLTAGAQFASALASLQTAIAVLPPA